MSRFDDARRLLVVGIVTLLCCCCSEGLVFAQGNDLSRKEERSLSDAVYFGMFGLGTKNDDGTGPRFLIVPDDVNTIFAKKPLGTLEFLLKITEVGRPEDSRNAAAFAFGVGREVSGWLFLSKLDKYDSDEPGYIGSRRVDNIKAVKRRIEEIKKEAK